MEKFTDFYSAWKFLERHPMFQYDSSSMLDRCLEVEVVKVNPRSGRTERDQKKNTTTRVWLECGPYVVPQELTRDWEIKEFPHGVPSVDPDLACGAPTFEKSIIKLATSVFKKYGTRDKRGTPGKAKQRIDKILSKTLVNIEENKTSIIFRSPRVLKS
jgi:hypothetical protein